MAKRKRLTPAAIRPTDAAAAPEASLETKGLRNGWAGTQVHSGSHAPIADVAGAAATTAALEELAHELQTARAKGRLVIKAPLESIDEGYLVRDRAGLDPDEMETLKASLRARGQQTPIEVVELGGDRLGLISGWRRLTALKALQDEAPEGGFGHVQCLVRQPETSSDAYIAMVEENEIRSGLNFYERARIAVRASEQEVFATPRAAAKALFGAVPRAKRSKIYSFIDLYAALDDVLRFPGALSEKLGLQLAKIVDEGTDGIARIKTALAEAAPKSAEEERAALEKIGSKPCRPKTKPLPAPAGIQISRTGQKITLSGADVTPAFEVKLKAWLDQL